MSETVNLSGFEYEISLHIAEKIGIMSREAGLIDRAFSSKGDALTTVGCLAEMAVAKWLDLFWVGRPFSFREADLSHRIEVRAITRPGDGLKVRDVDGDWKRVVGAEVGELGVFNAAGQFEVRIVGWINAVFGKRPLYYAEPYGKKPGAYWVPQENLFSLDKLRHIIAAEQAEGRG